MRSGVYFELTRTNKLRTPDNNEKLFDECIMILFDNPEFEGEIGNDRVLIKALLDIICKENYFYCSGLMACEIYSE